MMMIEMMIDMMMEMIMEIEMMMEMKMMMVMMMEMSLIHKDDFFLLNFYIVFSSFFYVLIELMNTIR